MKQSWDITKTPYIDGNDTLFGKNDAHIVNLYIVHSRVYRDL